MAKIRRMQFPLGYFPNNERLAYPKMRAFEDLRSFDLVTMNGNKANASVTGAPAFGFVRTDTQNVKTVYALEPFAVVSIAIAYLDTKFAVGTVLYLAVDGTLTDTAPVGAGEIVQPVGIVMQDFDEDSVQGTTSDMVFLDFDILKATTI